ncbi:hypothetical protein [Rivibacter subsaxonicus]|uniref:Tetratricopeptide repeat protein n=1 Tax=Rivibacter subsaxonicus TaxID=457575 RepID=A0A4V2FU41_9BURK|nr:hypothetical protein [Rivibacter subsaxonicus]RZU00556.1 hypothetical protein EV670_1266 [Rivibacter subsaxonicus]
MRALSRLLALVLAGLAGSVGAALHVPASDATVVATVRPRGLESASEADQRQLRRQLQQQPASLPLALGVAQSAIERARRDGDPRELGAAQAALAPWWGLADPPAGVRLLRAIVRQSQHQFEAALADFAKVHDDPRAAPALRAQAELSAAGVLQVLGRFDAARAHCERLLDSGPAALPARVCMAELDSLAGRTAPAAELLATLAARAAPSEAAWIALVRAELAERRGDARAGLLYQAALHAPDTYRLAAYADWLLANGRTAEVPTLLAGAKAADALLLRLAIAQRRLGQPEAAANRAALQARFEAARLRGDRLHAREEARAALDLDEDAARALGLAQAQWAQQKEPADALLLVRTARAAGRPEAAEPVWQFMRETGYRDARLQAPQLAPARSQLLAGVRP